MNTVCIWDGMTFERTPEGKWICKVWAMKGPSGTMMDKEVPERYAKRIEKDYQTTLKSSERFPSVTILGAKKEGSEIMKPVSKPEPTPKKPANKRQPKVPRQRKIKATKPNLGGAFNPFQ